MPSPISASIFFQSLKRFGLLPSCAARASRFASETSQGGDAFDLVRVLEDALGMFAGNSASADEGDFDFGAHREFNLYTLAPGSRAEL